MTEEESKALNESIRLNERLNALKNNEDFKELILKRFIDDGIKGNMMALPFAATDDSKKRHYANLEAIARLQGYFLAIERNAESAKQALQDDAEVEEVGE